MHLALWFCLSEGPGKPARHHALNDLVAWAMASAGILVSQEPQGLSRSENKRPDGLSFPGRQESHLLGMSPLCVRWLIRTLPQQLEKKAQ